MSLSTRTGQRAYKRDPAKWCRDILQFQPDAAQEAILRAIDRPGARVICESCNGAGKTTLAAIAVLRHLTSCRPSKVITMSGGERQVNTQLWSAIRAYAGKAIEPGWDCLTDSARIKTGDPEHFAVGFSAEDPGKVEGWHSPSLLFVVDEAKAIKQKIWDAVLSTLTTPTAKLLIMTVPGDPDAMPHTLIGSTYEHYRIIPEQCKEAVPPEPNLFYSSRVSDAFIAEMYNQYGKESAVYRRRVLAQSVHVAENPYFVEEHIKAMFQNDELPPGIGRGLAVDWGQKRDWTVVTEWRGKRGRVVFRCQDDYMLVIGRIRELHDQFRYDWLIVDEGEGRGQLDRLKELGLPVEGFNFGSSISGANAKLWIMSRLKMAMEARDIFFLWSKEAEDEFLAFSENPTSEGRKRLEASPGAHDDIVCSAAMGYWKASGGRIQTNPGRFDAIQSGKMKW